MSFTTEQVTQLLRAIHPDRVLHTQGQSHVSQQDIRAHLTRIFGFGFWDKEILRLECLRDVVVTIPAVPATKNRSGKPERKVPGVSYLCSLRLTVRCPTRCCVSVHEDVGTGTSPNLPDYGDAHDFAAKNGLALDTPIATPNGWTTMAALRVGDEVFDRHGQLAIVRGVSEVKHAACYRVTFRNGTSIVCDDEHLWVARIEQGRERVLRVAQLAEAKCAGKRVLVPVAGALDLPDADLPVDPWVLGFWLGNGDYTGGRLTCHQDDAGAVQAAVCSAGYELGACRDTTGTRTSTVRVKGLTKKLADLGVLGSKHVPAVYLRASARQRLALLAGLMDSDGSAGRHVVEFTNTRRMLAEAVAELARGLGERVNVSARNVAGFGVTTVLHKIAWTPGVVPFALPRKAGRTHLREKTWPHGVVSVERIPTVPTRCIAVDSPDRTFLAGRELVPTHNSVSYALKRCATDWGDQFGLSLYNKGQKDALVRGTLVNAPAGSTDDRETGDMQDGVPQQVSLGEDTPETEATIPAQDEQQTRPPVDNRTAEQVEVDEIRAEIRRFVDTRNASLQQRGISPWNLTEVAAAFASDYDRDIRAGTVEQLTQFLQEIQLEAQREDDQHRTVHGAA
jgi:hypothetical protein